MSVEERYKCGESNRRILQVEVTREKSRINICYIRRRED